MAKRNTPLPFRPSTKPPRPLSDRDLARVKVETKTPEQLGAPAIEVQLTFPAEVVAVRPAPSKSDGSTP